MRKIGVASLGLALLAGLVPVAVAYSGGPPPRTSGGDFPGEASCTRCHTGSPLNSGQGTLELLIGDSAAEGQSYTPGETVFLIVSFEDASAARIGFQLTARSGDGCGAAGSLATTSSANGSRIKVVEGVCGDGSSTVQWATQQSPRTGSAADFEVSWTAPAESVGPITIAVAVNGADGSLSTAGDKIYTAQATLASQVGPAGPPMISEGGVTLFGDATEAVPKAAPGAIVAVAGSNFATAGSEVAGTVDENGDLSTVVNGVCVEVGQTRAPILHVANDQILLQVPVGAALGPIAVQVIRECDSPTGGPQPVRSNISMFPIGSVQPIFLQASEAVPGLAALHEDLTVVAAEDAFADPEGEAGASPAPEPPPLPAARPAVPGDIVTLYGTGFGLVTPRLRSGELPDLPRGLAAASVKAMVGEFELLPEDIIYAGASPEVAGLYQVSARIPDAVPAGEHPFSLILDGQTSSVGPGLTTAMLPPPEVPACEKDLVLKPGESCTGSISGIQGTFSVVATGAQAGWGCITAPILPVPSCQETSQSLLGVFAATRGDDDSWTITKFPAAP